MTSTPNPPEMERHIAAFRTLIVAMKDMVAAVDAMPDPTMRWMMAISMMGNVDYFRDMITELQERSPQPKWGETP